MKDFRRAPLDVDHGVALLNLGTRCITVYIGEKARARCSGLAATHLRLRERAKWARNPDAVGRVQDLQARPIAL